MKKIYNYLFLLALISCNQTFVKSQNFENTKFQDKTTVSNYSIGSETRITYESIKHTEDGTCNFKGYCSMKTEPVPEIKMGLHFEKSGKSIQDTLDTQLFSKFMNLKDVKRIQVDSLNYKVIDNKIKLKFIISLIRDENDKRKVVDKYSMVYSFGFKNSIPDMVVDKIERSSMEILGNTY